MELSILVVVQHHGHLTLTLDFQVQILKMLYLRSGRADWHGTKGMWIDRMLHPLCDFQRSRWLIDMELKGCESIVCWTHAVTFLMSTSPMTFTLDFQGQILKKSYLRNGMADWHGTKGMWVDRMLHPLCDFQCPLHPWPWPWIFKFKFWKCCISGMGGQIDMERKGFESTECWTHVITFNVHLFHDLDFGFSRSNFEKVVSQEWDGRLTWNERDVSW